VIIELTIESFSNFTSIILSAYLGAFFIFSKHGNKRANFFLGCFMLLTSFSVLGSQFIETEEFHLLSIIFAPLFSGYLSTTILFLYSLALTNRFKTEKKRYKWIVIPVTVEIGLQYISLFVADNSFYNLIFEVVQVLLFPYSLFIFWLILKQIKIHNANILTLFSSIENKELNWLKHLILVNIGFIIIWVIDDSLMFFIDDNWVSSVLSEISLFATLVTIIWIGFAGVKQPIIFEKNNPTSCIKKNNPLNEKDEILFASIKLKIEQENLFTKTNLSLSELSDLLDLRDKELSRLINQCYGNNFFHFINSYRINYFKKLMKDPKNKNLSIVGLSMEAGFKSKSTFYTAFKKIEGITPTAYNFDAD